MNRDDDDLRFMWDGDEYAYDDFAIGERVQYREDSGPWKEGTVKSIDYDDPSLPWGVTTEPVEVNQEGEWDEDAHPMCSWNWMSPVNVRKAEYTIFEEEDEPQMAVSW